MPKSHQPDPDIARLKREIERDDAKLETRLRNLEAFEAYVRDDLHPWLEAFAAFGGFTAPPDPPA